MNEIWFTFVFAFFLLLQLVAWLVFARKITRDIKKIDASDRLTERENKIFRLYGNIEDMMDSFEQYVAKTKAELDQERREVIALSRQASTIYIRLMEQQPAEVRPLPPAPQVPVLSAAAPAAQSEEGQSGRLRVHKLPVGKAFGNERDAFGEEALMSRVATRKTLAEDADAQAGIFQEGGGFISKQDAEALARFPNKTQKVRYLKSRGVGPDGIAKELGIGRGEVQLILDLEK